MERLGAALGGLAFAVAILGGFVAVRVMTRCSTRSFSSSRRSRWWRSP
jgi:hypothetical protein